MSGRTLRKLFLSECRGSSNSTNRGHINMCHKSNMDLRYILNIVSHKKREFFFLLFCRLKWVSILGTKYKVGCMLNIGCDEIDNPTFGKVIKICVVNKNVRDIIFAISKLNTAGFSTHYQSFEVATHGRQLDLVHHKDLESFLPLSLTKPYGVKTRNKYIVQRFDIGTNN